MLLRRSPFLILPLAALALLVAFSPGTCEAVDLDSAQQDLDMLKKSMKPRATNDDLYQYLDAVYTAFKDPDQPEKPAEDAPDEEKKAYSIAKAKSDKLVAKYRKDTEKLFLKIMTLVKVKHETNTRDDVNTKAATMLGSMATVKDADGKLILTAKGRKDLSKRIMQAIEKKLTKVKTHDVSTDHLDAAFAALGKLNDMNSLLWMAKNYTHANDNRKEYLIAAHKAMVLFKNVPGKIRFEVCSAMIKTYAGVESQAQQTKADPKILAKKDFWDAIKTFTIPVLQYFADKPEDEEGQALAEVKQFQQFMRSHRNLKKAPWIDEKIEDGKK